MNIFWFGVVMPGKLPPKIMEKIVYRRLGAPDPCVLIGPAVGEDAAIIDIGGGLVLVVHSDAISGASEFLGWLAVHIAANDIAVRGAKPKWFLMSLFLPEVSTENLLDKIMAQVDGAAKELGMMIVGGHTERTPGISRPLVGTMALGLTEKNRVVTTSGARVGDYLIMSKTAALEGTAILCTDFAETLRSRGVSDEVLAAGSSLLFKVSIVREALALADRKLATSMHDPTEGGILGGIAEIAYSSKKTIELWVERVPIADETKIVAKALGIDVLRLISSGALIASIPPEKVDEAIRTLNSLNIEASVIGRVKEYTGHLIEVIKGSSIIYVDEVYVVDEIYRLWENLA
ncbi:MAG: AIR synthase family protein [Candidatus Bathyarchaeia archaeon]